MARVFWVVLRVFWVFQVILGSKYSLHWSKTSWQFQKHLVIESLFHLPAFNSRSVESQFISNKTKSHDTSIMFAVLKLNYVNDYFQNYI